MENRLTLSTLPKLWIFDLDGTILKHNGYKTAGEDTLLPGVREWFAEIPGEDRILIVTSRTEEYRRRTTEFLHQWGIRYDAILFEVPVGERIVVNDRKPSGIDMAVAVSLERDHFAMPVISREK